MTTRCGLLLALPGNSLKGHEDSFLGPGPSHRCRLGQETSPGASANG